MTREELERYSDKELRIMATSKVLDEDKFSKVLRNLLKLLSRDDCINYLIEE